MLSTKSRDVPIALVIREASRPVTIQSLTKPYMICDCLGQSPDERIRNKVHMTGKQIGQFGQNKSSSLATGTAKVLSKPRLMPVVDTGIKVPLELLNDCERVRVIRLRLGYIGDFPAVH